MSLQKKLMEISPYFEILIRHTYWKLRKAFPALDREWVLPNGPTDKSPVDFGAILNHLANEGVKPGSLLLVHSSAAALASTGLNEKQILKSLKNLVGETGTLAMPAIPRMPEQATGAEYIFGDVAGVTLTYDIKRTPPWTGLLPFFLMKQPGAIRSRHPVNSMVALGRLAAPMMAKELDEECPLPCGPNSPWAYCAEHGAIIVGLGIDIAQSLTIIHVNEDCHAEEWPIAGWYRKRIFNLVAPEGSRAIEVKERLPRFALNYGGYSLAKDLRKVGILREHTFGNMLVSTLNARDLMKFLSERRASGYPFFFFPWQRRSHASN